MRRFLIPSIVAVCLLVIGIVLQYRLAQPNQYGGAPGVVRLSIDFGDATRVWDALPMVTGASAFSIMKDAVAVAQIPLVADPSTGAGVFVRQIGNKKNGDGGRFWQYWVNEKFAMVAADTYMLSAGDRVEWKFVEEQR